MGQYQGWYSGTVVSTVVSQQEDLRLAIGVNVSVLACLSVAMFTYAKFLQFKIMMDAK